MKRAPGWWRVAVMALALGVFICDSAAAVKLRIRGGVQLAVRAIPRDAGLEVRGNVRDDSGRPLGRAQVRARLLSGPGQPAVSIPSPETCPPTPRARLHYGQDEVVADTDGAGAFCFVIPRAGLRGQLEVRFEGDELYEPAASMLSIDGAKRSLSLRFVPEPRVLPLDRASHRIWIETRADPPASDDASERLPLTLSLKEGDGPARELAKSVVSVGERAELEVRSKDLGAPGAAVLAVQFAGSAALQSASALANVQKTARVQLSLAGTIPTTGTDVTLNVAVGSASGAVGGGAVEAVLDGRSLGTAPVQEGAAQWTGTIEGPRAGSVDVSVRYLPDAPWWLPGEPLTVTVPVAPPSPWRRLPWILAALTIAVWVIWGWRRPARQERKQADDAPPSGRPSVDVISRGPAQSGWKGRVVDAHEGTAIPAAQLVIRVPTFASDTAAKAVSDADGRFELPHVAAAEGAELVVTARWHSRLVRSLPPEGELVVHLLERRRAVLERLIGWARRMGPPWSESGDPTPGEVGQLADRHANDPVRGWARAVEAAAFGPEPPDESVEDELRQREPRVEGRKRER